MLVFEIGEVAFTDGCREYKTDEGWGTAPPGGKFLTTAFTLPAGAGLNVFGSGKFDGRGVDLTHIRDSKAP
jgi:hypothetical protein